MKLIDLKPVIFSQTGDLQTCIIYDKGNNVDLEYECSVEYAYMNYGEREIQRVSTSYEGGEAQLVLSII